MIEISFFVPVYNEENSIKQNLSKIYSFLHKNFKSFELIVVDDNSNDGSQKIIKELMKSKKIKLIECNKGPTRRENLAQSFLQAKSDIIMFFDSDSIQSLNGLPRLVEEIKKGKDIAIGSRYAQGSKIKRKIFRLLLSFLYNKFIRFYFNSKIRDHNGSKVFNRKKLTELIKEIGYDNSFSRGWFWDAELLIRAQKKEMKIIELPVVWYDQRKSSFNLSREIKMIPYIFHFKKKLRLK